jgi:hypothetical protein
VAKGVGDPGQQAGGRGQGRQLVGALQEERGEDLGVALVGEVVAVPGEHRRGGARAQVRHYSAQAGLVTEQHV